MRYTYLLNEAAQMEYEKALQWYNERSKRTAENFVIAVNNTLELICNNPTRWRNEYHHYFELGVKKYPYTIIYFIEANKHLIIVSAIYHHKRNPKNKYRK